MGINKPTHLLNLIRRQLKLKRQQIITQPLFLAGRSDRHDILINAPPETNLGGTDAVFLRQSVEDAINGTAGGLGDGG